MGKGLWNEAARRRATKGGAAKTATARLQKDASESKLARLSLQRDRMLKLLDAQPEVWPDVIFMLESGYFKDEAEVGENTTHPSCNKWHMLSSERLYAIYEPFIGGDILDRLFKNEIVWVTSATQGSC